MAFRKLSPSLYQLSHLGVNCFLIERLGWTLVDTGTPEMGPKILKGLRELGLDSEKLSRIILTHCHPDHAGSAAFLQRELGLPIFSHPEDGVLMEVGISLRRPFSASPGLLNKLLYNAFIANAAERIEPVSIERFLNDGEELAGGIKVIHTPGHSKGHIALLFDRTLVAGDAISNVGWLRPSIANEDYATALSSISKLSRLDFEIACFGHGAPILKSASKRFRGRNWIMDNKSWSN